MIFKSSKCIEPSKKKIFKIGFMLNILTKLYTEPSLYKHHIQDRKNTERGFTKTLV